ncbi:MAG TPA: SDR family oxidoreductase [Acidimicrobiales bacterium]|nr:SDR family oxidoreductase [Acidimicrobiales bacterium]
MAEAGGPLQGFGVLVTGGGTGIGRACAARLARDGAVVTICGRTEERLRSVSGELSSAGLQVGHVVADVTREDDVRRAVDAAVEAAGNLRGVVANAGGGGGLGPYHRQDTAEYIRVLELNVVGTMLCIKHSVPHLVAAGAGSFVGMSSIAGAVTHQVFGAYPVAKAGIDHMMRNAADEYGPANVRFNSVQPGFVTTEIMEGIPRDGSVFESYLVNTPLGGTTEPDEVGAVVSFLIGPDSSRITGQAIAVDGGHHLRSGPDFRPFTGLTADQLLGRE